MSFIPSPVGNRRGLDSSGEPGALAPHSNLNVFLRFYYAMVGLLGAAFSIASSAGAAFARAALQQANIDNPNLIFDPATAAAGFLKAVDTSADWVGEAGLSGMSPARFGLLADILQTAPGPSDLFAMVNRGALDAADLPLALSLAGYTDPYLSAWTKLQRSILSPADYVEADIQNAPTGPVPGEGSSYWQDQAAAAGLDPTEYQTAYWIAGNPPGPGEVLQMFNRGILTLDEATQALKESRLKDKYIGYYLELSRRIIPFRTLNTLIKNGSVSEAYALTQLGELGYSQADAEALVASASSAVTAKHKLIPVTKIIDAYEGGAMAEADAIAALELAGYDAPSAQELLTLADATATLKLQTQAVSKVRTIYVAHRMDDATAQSELSTLGVSPQKAALMLEVWKLEQEANIAELTVAELKAMVKANIITATDFTARIIAKGYTPADAGLLTQLDAPAPPSVPTV